MIGVTVTTTGEREDALRISKKFVESGLIACAQIERIESIFYWEGALHHDEEYRVTMKHPIASAEELRESLLRIHPYDVPEVTTWEAETTFEYGEWVVEQCRENQQ